MSSGAIHVRIHQCVNHRYSRVFRNSVVLTIECGTRFLSATRFLSYNFPREFSVFHFRASSETSAVNRYRECSHWIFHSEITRSPAETINHSIVRFQLGDLTYFSLEYWTTVINFRHTCGIKSIFCDSDGTKLLYIDDHNQGYVYCPVKLAFCRFDFDCSDLILEIQFALQTSTETVLIPNLPKTCKGALWDCANGKSFIAFDDKICVSYAFFKYSIDGNTTSSALKMGNEFEINFDFLQVDKHVKRIDETALLSDQKPIMLYDGDLCLATSDGTLSSITLKSHINSPTVELKDQLKVLIKLHKYFDAWEVCKLIDDVDSWKELGMAAVADLNVTFGEHWTTRMLFNKDK